MSSDLATLPDTTARLSDTERHRVVSNVIQGMRAGLQADGGDITLVAIDGDKIRVRLSGACVGCGSAGLTLGGIRRQLVQELGEPVLVVPATFD
ncbi:MAG TPA: NifU family protein [Candidatus Sulfotelmatobacter sp.]|nr:NifU family protein [Candidatus Sulfotelmatobacter sp.]